MNNTEIVAAPSYKANEPRNWTHRYDKIVFLKIQGWDHTQIAEEVGLSVTRVNVVLNSQPGKDRTAEWQARLKDHVLSTIEEDLLSLGKQAVVNIADTINAEVSMKSRAKKHQDQVSFEVLARIGFNKMEKKVTDAGSGIAGLQPELQERIAKALEKSDEATRIYEMPAQDAEFEEVNDDSDD